MTKPRKVLVTGATGFIGKALVTALRERDEQIIATSRKDRANSAETGVEWRTCDLLRPDTLATAVSGAQVAYFLVHSMGGANVNYRDLERRSAEAFAETAAECGLERIVYLGGPAPQGVPSEHLRSRLEVGEILRAGQVPTIELRASMVIGPGGASWQIVRDLAMRLPAMVLPRWLRSRTKPVALEDVTTALVAAADVSIRGSSWFDIPGPELLNGREILERVAALHGRHIYALEVPLLTPQLSALWLRLVTRADFELARELVQGMREDLIPKDARYWELIGHSDLVPFDEAARRALSAEGNDRNMWERLVEIVPGKRDR